MAVSVRCPDCKTVIKFTGKERVEGCEMFERCSGLNVSAMMLNKSIKRCNECGLNVKLETTNVTLMIGVAA